MNQPKLMQQTGVDLHGRWQLQYPVPCMYSSHITVCTGYEASVH